MVTTKMIKKTGLNRLILGGIVLGVTLFSSCSDQNKHMVDVAGSEVTVTINRLEDDIFSVKTVEDYKALDKIDQSFMHYFKRGIMGPETRDGSIPVEESTRGFVEFTANSDMQDLYRTVDSMFPNLEAQEAKLSKAFSYYHYHFPDKTIPKFYSIVTPFRSMVMTTDSAVGICLDMYLGADFTPYLTPTLNFPQFLINRFRKEYLTPNVVKGWLESEYTSPQQARLLDEMIYTGKILCAMDAILPETHDSLKIGYPAGKIEWCNENEVQIWTHLIDQKLLYSTSYRDYAGVVTDGPFSKGMHVPQESPPKIAIWAGWQIVRKYMEKNPDVTLAQLMENQNPDDILRLSGYKP